MKIRNVLLFPLLTAINIFAQQTTFQDSLLDRMTGQWLLKGTIAGQETTHDVDVSWVLRHQYIQIHEKSRETNAGGTAAYEAIVYIGWDKDLSEYTCLWLDVTGSGGLSCRAIAHAKRQGNKLAFLFKGENGSIFHTTFAYNKDDDSWQWLMDSEENGKLRPFARVKLTGKA